MGGTSRPYHEMSNKLAVIKMFPVSKFSPSVPFGECVLAVKAVTAAQLSMASDGIYRVTLDEAIEAMRLTAADMSVKYKETSLSVSCSLFYKISVGSGAQLSFLSKLVILAGYVGRVSL